MVSVVAVVVDGANMTDLQQAFERHLVRSRFFATQDKVVVAVSTGVDSMVLLDLLQHLSSKNRPQIIVAHMNHELRKQSQLEERFIRQYCKQNDLNPQLRTGHKLFIHRPGSKTLLGKPAIIFFRK